MNLSKSKIICLFFCIWSLTSCAYFNTFHNTKKLYNEAAKERKKRQTDMPTPTELRLYDQTIEKASKILEVYPNSKYVDDALFILGVCFYYKEEYIRAQRKFQELITYFSKSDFAPRAKIWLARTNLELGDFTSTEGVLKELLAAEKLDDDVREQSQLLLGESFFQREQYDAAEAAFQKAGEISKNDANRSRAYLELGKCQIINGKYEQAITSYEKALKHNSDLDFRFDAKLNYAKSLKLAGQFSTAKQICAELLDNESYQKKYGLVKLEEADCKYYEAKALASGLKRSTPEYRSKIQEALDDYKLITIEHKGTEYAATAYYSMGQIYLNEFSDFARASENFEQVRAEFSRSEHADYATNMLKDLRELIRLNNLVKQAQGEELITQSGDSHRLTELQLLLLEQGNHPEIEFMKKRAEHTKAQIATGRFNPNDPLQTQDDISKLAANKLNLAEVYLFQFGEVDSALQEYAEIVDLFPEHPATAQALYASSFIYEHELQDRSRRDSVLTILVQRFPDSVLAREAKSKLGLPVDRNPDDRAAALFRNAEGHLLARHEVDEALQAYQEVVDLYPRSDYAPKALFAMGWIQERLRFNNERAAEIYRKLVADYPQSDFASAVNSKLREIEKASSPGQQPEPTANRPTDLKSNLDEPPLLKVEAEAEADSLIDEIQEDSLLIEEENPAPKASGRRPPPQ